MVNQVIKERIDLHNLPKSHYPKSDAITIGDLHGNTLKLVHFLLRHNIVRFKDKVANPDKAYQSFAAFYEDSRERVTPCITSLATMDYNQKRIDEQKEKLEENTIAFEDMLMTILPEGLQSKEFRQNLSGASNRYDFFQYLPKISDVVKTAAKTVIGSYATEQDKPTSENLRENFRGIIRIHSAETKDKKRLGEKLAELLPEIQATFPEIVQEFRELIEQRENLTRYHDNFIKDNLKLENKLAEDLKSIVEIVPIFNRFLETLEVIDRETLVRLIGDEMADRGSNDYFTLRFLDFLHENGVKIHTNISNHSNEFIGAYEGRDFNSPGVVIGKQQPSFLALKLLVERSFVSRDEVNTLIERSYKPTLRVIDYSLNDTGITLFTHAPVDFNLIRLTADKFDVPYDDSTKEALATTIDGINSAFAVVVAKNRVHELCDTKGVSEPKNMTREEIREHPLLYIIWNRWNADKDTEEARPAVVNGYSCTYVHGHDDYPSQFKHVINLDTSCGKGDLKTEKSKVADAVAVLKSEPDSPLGLEAKNYLESLEERVLVSGYTPTAVQSFKQELGQVRDAGSSADDDSQLRGP